MHLYVILSTHFQLHANSVQFQDADEPNDSVNAAEAFAIGSEKSLQNLFSNSFVLMWSTGLWIEVC